MKLNTILTCTLIVLFGMTFLLFVDEKPTKSKDDFLFRPIDDEVWIFEIDHGVLSRKSSQFFWNEKEIPNNDQELPKVLRKIGDLRIIRNVDEMSWTKKMEQAEFVVNDKRYALSKLNDLTGRFMIFDKQLRKVYLIEDQAPLQELHKSYEVGQKIKYYNLLMIIKNQKWDL